MTRLAILAGLASLALAAPAQAETISVELGAGERVTLCKPGPSSKIVIRREGVRILRLVGSGSAWYRDSLSRVAADSVISEARLRNRSDASLTFRVTFRS